MIGLFMETTPTATPDSIMLNHLLQRCKQIQNPVVQEITELDLKVLLEATRRLSLEFNSIRVKYDTKCNGYWVDVRLLLTTGSQVEVLEDFYNFYISGKDSSGIYRLTVIPDVNRSVFTICAMSDSFLEDVFKMIGCFHNSKKCENAENLGKDEFVIKVVETPSFLTEPPVVPFILLGLFRAAPGPWTAFMEWLNMLKEQYERTNQTALH